MRGVVCLLVSAVVIAVLALVAAQLPPRARLLGLFAVGFGILCGVCVVVIRRECGLRSRWWMAVAATLAAGGFAGQCALQFSAWQTEIEKSREAFLEGLGASGQLLNPAVDMQKLGFDASFDAFLRFRFAPLDPAREFSEGTMQLLFAAEILLAAIGAMLGFLVLRTRARPEIKRTES